MKRTILVLVFVASVAPAAVARIRAVHRPAPHSCTFSLSPTWNGSIGAGGVTRAMVMVFGQTDACAAWAAYSSASWAVVEAAPKDAQPAAYVTLAANESTAPRTANLIIAGVRLQVTQEGAPTISPPAAGNLIVNGSFDTGIAPWGWGNFPNGTGTATWSQFDANGSPASGSFLLRDTGAFEGLQRSQCVRVAKNTTYRYGAKVRTASPNDQGQGEIAVFGTPIADCSGEYRDFTFKLISNLRPSASGAWEEFSFAVTTASRTEALLIVISSSATVHPFEMWFDDIFLRKQ